MIKETKNTSAVNSTNYQQQFKQSNAQTNANIVIRNNRLVDTNSIDQVERLKNEVIFLEY